MEKLFTVCGLFIGFTFFIAAFFFGNQLLWGCAAGGAMSALGLLFME